MFKIIFAVTRKMRPIHRKKFVDYKHCGADSVVTGQINVAQSDGTKAALDLTALSNVTAEKVAILDSMAAEATTAMEVSFEIDMTQAEFEAAGGVDALLAAMAAQTGGTASST